MPQALSKTKLSFFRKFLLKKMRVGEGKFLIEGWHLLEEALKSGVRLESLVYDESVDKEAAESKLLDRAIAESGEVFFATPEQMSQISDTKSSQGVAALVDAVGMSFETFFGALPTDGELRVVCLDSLGDPGNVGSIIRTCDWFGVDGVVLGTGCAELENGKVARSTMGGLFHLPIAVGVDLPAAIFELKKLSVSCLTTELDGAESLKLYDFPNRAALVIGNEARGVSKEVSSLADQRLFVPRFGRGESLNAASAASVFLAAWRL